MLSFIIVGQAAHDGAIRDIIEYEDQALIESPSSQLIDVHLYSTKRVTFVCKVFIFDKRL